MNDLKDKVNGYRKTRKHNYDNNEKVTTGKKKKCKHCGEKHGREYWDKKKSRYGNTNGSNLILSEKQTSYINKMINKQMLRNSQVESNSESDGNGAPDWTKGLNFIQQMYITREFKKNNGYKSEDQTTHVNLDELDSLKKKCRKAEK